MANKKFSFKWNALALFPLIGIVLLGIFFIYLFVMQANPSAFNPDPGKYSDLEYLYSSSNMISITFATILFFYFIFLSLDLLFRKDCSHILLVLIGEAIISAYAISKTVWTFSYSFTRQIMSVVFLIIGDISLICMHYFYLKKALDGDYGAPYLVCLFTAGLAFFFGVVQYDSLLDAYSYLDDLVFFGDWGIAHIMVALFVGLALINIRSDYDPEPLNLTDTHVDLSKGN